MNHKNENTTQNSYNLGRTVINSPITNPETDKFKTAKEFMSDKNSRLDNVDDYQIYEENSVYDGSETTEEIYPGEPTVDSCGDEPCGDEMGGNSILNCHPPIK